MLNTLKDIEDYVYIQANKMLGNFIGEHYTKNSQVQFDLLAKKIENELGQLLPIAISAPDIEISQSRYDLTKINIKITPKSYYQYPLYKEYTISIDNLKTHDIGSCDFVSTSFTAMCKNCGYKIHKESDVYYSYIGDFSCNEYLIKNIIE